MKKLLALLLALVLALGTTALAEEADVAVETIGEQTEQEALIETEDLDAEAAEVEAPEEEAPEEAPEAELLPEDAGEAEDTEEAADALAEANDITMIDEDHWYDESGLVYAKYRVRWNNTRWRTFAKVIDYGGESKEVVIPGESNGYTVQMIEDRAFGDEDITQVTLPENLASIGEWAFAGTNLTSLVLPDFTSNIYEGAFAECTQLKEVHFGTELSHIGANAFKQCTSLESVVLPKDIVDIGDSAFYGCEALEELELGGVQTIGEGAFASTYIRSVTLPDSLTKLGKYAFQFCPLLEEVRFGSGLKVIPQSAFKQCISLREVVLPEGVDGIELDAFMNCPLERVVLPASIKSIENGAFFMIFNCTLGGMPASTVINNPYAHYECNSPYTELWYQSWHAGSADKADLAECFVYTPAQVYTGKAMKPDPVVSYNGKIYTPGNDFTVKYANNKKVGYASMTLTGLDPLSGTTTSDFRIIPRNTKLKSLKSKKKGQLTVTWKKQATQTSGYELFYIKESGSGSWKMEHKIVKGGKKTSVTLKGLESGATYRVMIATYKTVKGDTLYGVDSDLALYQTAKRATVK